LVALGGGAGNIAVNQILEALAEIDGVATIEILLSPVNRSMPSFNNSEYGMKITIHKKR
jgi:hypothetical protein